MAEQQNRILTQHLTSTVHFDDRTALHLTQAFNQETSLDGLLDLAKSQLMALCGAYGLTFTHQSLDLDLQKGQLARHTAEYNLEAEGQHLGTLTIYFPRHQNEHEIQTCEDLISLAFTALRNQITLMSLQRSPDQTQPSESASALSNDEKADALVLVALDGYADMKARDGDEWSQVLMSSVHTQIKEGLRQADGVYQITEELIAVLLPHTTRGQAQEVAEKIRVLVASLHLSDADTDKQLTASMGISDAKLASTAEEVMANAKTALAAAKDQGYNTIQTYDEALISKLGIG